ACVSTTKARRHTGPGVFPYTTLFRSGLEAAFQDFLRQRVLDLLLDGAFQRARAVNRVEAGLGELVARRFRQHELHVALGEAVARSEEHTSELQSREKLVCRLLPEKKK